MQWDKVKVILCIILSVVNLFFGGNLLWQHLYRSSQQAHLRQDIVTVLQTKGVEVGTSLEIPARCSAIALASNRDTAMEEQVANGLLQQPVREEDADGTNRFSAQNGTMTWKSDGSVEATISGDKTQDIPSSPYALRQRARTLLEQCGFSLRAATWMLDKETHTATVTSTIAGNPVFGRSLSVCFQENGRISIAGRWSFGTPYARTVDQEQTYEAGDAILRFAQEGLGIGKIDAMEFGYAMEVGNAGTIQFLPAWRFTTDQGVYLVNTIKTNPEIS